MCRSGEGTPLGSGRVCRLGALSLLATHRSAHRFCVAHSGRPLRDTPRPLAQLRLGSRCASRTLSELRALPSRGGRCALTEGTVSPYRGFDLPSRRFHLPLRGCAGGTDKTARKAKEMTVKFITVKGSENVGRSPFYIGVVQHERTMSRREAYEYCASTLTSARSAPSSRGRSPRRTPRSTRSATRLSSRSALTTRSSSTSRTPCR